MTDVLASSPPRTTRRPGRPAASQTPCADGRSRLLEVAVTIFGQHGFDGASLRTIAEGAGLDPAMVSHHFGSKARLWQAALGAIVERQEEHAPTLRAIIGGAEPLVARMHAAIDFFIGLAAQRREVFLFFSRELHSPGWRLDALNTSLAEPFYRICEPLRQEAIDAGIVQSQHPAVFHTLVLGAICITLDSSPTITHLAGQEIDRPAITRALRAILQGHFPATPDAGGSAI